jgi:hypothetical protein
MHKNWPVHCFKYNFWAKIGENDDHDIDRLCFHSELQPAGAVQPATRARLDPQGRRGHQQGVAAQDLRPTRNAQRAILYFIPWTPGAKFNS